MALGVLQRQVADMVDEGIDLAEVELAIEATKLGEEEKSALWLLAWSCQNRAHDPPALDERPVRL
jgi:hypothetical protein